MKIRSILLGFLLACSLTLNGCSSTTDEDSNDRAAALEDSAGVTLGEVQDMVIQEQYQSAEDRYVHLQELFGDLSADIHDGNWIDNGATEIVPAQGNTVGRAPEGATSDNSYYFSATRWHESDQDLRVVLDQAAASWQDREWQVNLQSNEISPDSRVTAVTPEGYWFALEPDTKNQQLLLRGQSPVYWGDYEELTRAISDRADVEDAAGMPWDTTDRDDKTGQALRKPGEYRPFPVWDVIQDTNTMATDQ